MFYSVFVRTDIRFLLPRFSHSLCKRTVFLPFYLSVAKGITHRLSIRHETAFLFRKLGYYYWLKSILLFILYALLYTYVLFTIMPLYFTIISVSFLSLLNKPKHAQRTLTIFLHSKYSYMFRCSRIILMSIKTSAKQKFEAPWRWCRCTETCRSTYDI